jgi:hypothetical protein
VERKTPCLSEKWRRAKVYRSDCACIMAMTGRHRGDDGSLRFQNAYERPASSGTHEETSMFPKATSTTDTRHDEMPASVKAGQSSPTEFLDARSHSPEEIEGLVGVLLI